jgi:hypothetical protein
MPLDVGSHRYGVFICYEAVFPHEVRRFAEHGAEVFVNISNDGWYGDLGAPWQHLNMARKSPLAVEGDQYRNYGVNRSVGARRGANPAEAAGCAGCAVRADERHYFLHPLWRLVSDTVCHNLNHGIALARPYGSAHYTRSPCIGEGSRMIDQQLEHEFSALRDKVRELQEYL